MFSGFVKRIQTNIILVLKSGFKMCLQFYIVLQYFSYLFILQKNSKLLFEKSEALKFNKQINRIVITIIVSLVQFS